MKKIMAVLLSVALLFAFAACDNSTTNPYFGQQVQRVVFDSAPDYVVGDTINPADVKVTVEYDNGSVTLTGADVGMYNTTDGFVAKTAGYATFSANYGSDNPYLEDSSAAKTWTIKVPVYAIDEIKVNAENGPATIEKGAKAIDYEDLMDLDYTIVYTKGSEELERSVSYIDLMKMNVVVSAAADASTADIDDEIAVKVSATQSSDPVDTTVTPKDWTVTVVADQSTVIESVAIEQNTKADVFYIAEAPEGASSSTTLKSNKVNDLPWKVTVTFGNGDEVVYTGTGSKASTAGTDARISSLKVEFIDFVNPATTTLVSAARDTFNVRITVDPTAGDAKNFIENTTVKFVYTEDYPTVITAKTAADKTFKAGDTFDESVFTFYATEYASGIKYEADKHELSSEEEANIVLKTTSVDWGTADGPYDVDFEWSDDSVNTTPDISGSITVANE